ncbi:asialoglycoprotein receptor 1 [Taeniopygia guttata]|uniref:asialoglycoprotein receptor 1 n=1 Tax=Taeniopygia guttata TaxID=59729 RepID=UPI003BB93F74
MAQPGPYGNWIGPGRLQRQPGIYSVAGRISPVGDFRPASPDSFEADYDDVSMAGSERGPPAKGVYLLAGPPQGDPEDSQRKFGNSEPESGNGDRKSGNGDRKSGNSDRKSGHRDRKCGQWAMAAAMALLGLAWGGLLAAAVGKHQALWAELELLKSNFSAVLDSLQQEQTRLHFGIRQHQLEQEEQADLLCRALGSSRRCGPGWRSHAGSCYSFSGLALSWGRARAACEDLGAQLAVVSDEAEQLFLVQNSNRSSSYWLGVTDAEQEGKWRWVNGEEPQIGFWDVWLQEEQQELKDCGALGPKGRWVSAACAEPLRWVCERPGHC